MTFPELSFFATQNVFAPGKQAIISKKFMGPYDFIVLGDIVEPVKPAMRRAVMHALKPDTGHNSTQLFKRDAVPAAASQTDKQRMKAMMDDFHEDDFGFAKDVVGDEDAYKACFSSRNYDIGKADPSCLTGLTTPGPDFDIRYCAGVYRLETSSDAHDPGKVLYVDALQRTIWSKSPLPLMIFSWLVMADIDIKQSELDHMSDRYKSTDAGPRRDEILVLQTTERAYFDLPVGEIESRSTSAPGGMGSNQYLKLNLYSCIDGHCLSCLMEVVSKSA